MMDCLIKSLPNFVYFKNTDLRYVICNQNFANLVGIASSDALKNMRDVELKSWIDLMENNEKCDATVISTGLPLENITQRFSNDRGETFEFITQKTPIFDANKKIIGVLSISEKNKNASVFDQIIFKHLIEHIPYYIFWKDKNFRYIGCNDNFSRLIGFKSRYEVLGKTDYDLNWGQGEADLFRDADARILKDHLVQINEEETLIRPDGDEIVMLVSKVPVFNEEGNPIGILGISTDITKLKNVEKELRVMTDKAERASRAKSEFISNMSHDIRTPITGILGLAEIMRNRLRDHSDQDDMELIINAVDELLLLVNEILEVGKSDSGLLQTEMSQFDIRKVIDHNINMLRPTLVSHRLQMSYAIDDNVPQLLEGCRLLTDRVILNILGNSVKYTPKGRIKIHVSALPHEDDYIMLKISVADTGIGIAKDKLEEIFQPFKRLHPSYEGIYKGSGLGLYTARQYVEAMNGSISVESEVNKGSIFTISIPIKVAKIIHEELDSRTVVKKEFSAQKNYDPKTIRILVVEDSRVAQKIATSIIASLGYQVDIAEDGNAALRKIEFNDYHLIYMDIGLPDRNGFEVTKAIRSLGLPSKNSIPIIALTAHLSSENKIECINSGMQGFVSKPLSKEQVLIDVSQFIHP